MEKQFLIQFDHDSKRLGIGGVGFLLISANTFEQACNKIGEYGRVFNNPNNNYTWMERYTNARNFINLTI